MERVVLLSSETNYQKFRKFIDDIANEWEAIISDPLVLNGDLMGFELSDLKSIYHNGKEIKPDNFYKFLKKEKVNASRLTKYSYFINSFGRKYTK